MKRNFFSFLACGLITAVSVFILGCDDYLDTKAKSNMSTPSTLTDCQALLDDYSRMNSGYPSDGEASADNYYLPESSWNALSSLQDRERYIWDARSQPVVSQWLNPYACVYNANLVLQPLKDITREPANALEYDRIKGSALFFRAYAFYSLLQLFAPAYHPGEDNRADAIPLRLSPDIDDVSKRATVSEAYTRVIADLREAVSLLPVGSSIMTRPDKTAALAELARVCLCMQDYIDAGDAADKALQLRAGLLSYSELDSLALLPFAPRFNTEVIFHSVSTIGGQFGTSYAITDSSLVAQYASGDLRKNLFFVNGVDGEFYFRGSYDGTQNSTLFTGLTTAELYLIRAECAARSGNISAAMDDLNLLLAHRWESGRYRSMETADPEEALRIILRERRKELVFRDLRWGDLRRLNQDERFRNTLTRQLGTSRYILEPQDPRYVLLLPKEVIENTSFTQNPR